MRKMGRKRFVLSYIPFCIYVQSASFSFNQRLQSIALFWHLAVCHLAVIWATLKPQHLFDESPLCKVHPNVTKIHGASNVIHILQSRHRAFPKSSNGTAGALRSGFRLTPLENRRIGTCVQLDVYKQQPTKISLFNIFVAFKIAKSRDLHGLFFFLMWKHDA